MYMLILCLARVAVLGVAAITLANSTAVTAAAQRRPGKKKKASRRTLSYPSTTMSRFVKLDEVSNDNNGRKKAKKADDAVSGSTVEQQYGGSHPYESSTSSEVWNWSADFVDSPANVRRHSYDNQVPNER
jgi:glucose dehydrogenase